MRAAFDLSGRVALVTGAGSGLGLAMARGLAEAGARVVLNGRNRDKLEAAAAPLRGDGLQAETADFDVTDSQVVNGAVARIAERFGAIDILVNNAGVQHRAPIEQFSDADWRRVLATNLDAPFFLARAVIPAMKARRSGKIVNIGSLMSSLARPTTVPYQVSKGGIAMLTRGLAVELAPHGIQVNAIAPGFFRTEMNTALTSNPGVQRLGRETNAGRALGLARGARRHRRIPGLVGRRLCDWAGALRRRRLHRRHVVAKRRDRRARQRWSSHAPQS